MKILGSIDRYWHEAIRRHRWIRRFERIRTYIYLSAGLANFLLAVALGITLLGEQSPGRRGILAFFTVVCIFLVARFNQFERI